MRGLASDLRTLQRLIPSENNLTVFDAETQETSYGICFFGGLPHIFDTHRKDGCYVATIELLTEIVSPVHISHAHIRAFCGNARRLGLLPIPYTGCFFKGNLHVYSFTGPVRGFDLAAVGRSADESERRLRERMARLRRDVPRDLTAAQRKLLGGRRKVRHAADRDVLIRRWKDAPSPDKA